MPDGPLVDRKGQPPGVLKMRFTNLVFNTPGGGARPGPTPAVFPLGILFYLKLIFSDFYVISIPWKIVYVKINWEE